MATPLNVIRTITIKSTTQGVNQTTTELNKLADAQQNVATTSSQTERAQTSMSRALERHQRSLDATYRASQQYAQVQRDVLRAQQQGLVSQERANELMALASRRLHDAGVANDNMVSGTKAARYELINFSRQLQDVVVGLGSGQKATTVFLQQGTQMADIFASSSQGAGGFARQLLSLITPARVAAGGIALIGAAAGVAYQSWKTFAFALDDARRIAGVTSQALSALQAAAEFKGIAQSDFLRVVEEFSQRLYEARTSVNSLGILLAANRRPVGDFARSFGDVADLVKAAGNDMTRAFSILQQAGLPATMQWVRFLQQGREGIEAATREATKFGGVANDNLVQRAREFDEVWNTAITNVSRYLKAFTVDAIRWFVELFTGIKNDLRDIVLEILNLPAKLAGVSQLDIGKRLLGTTEATRFGPIKQQLEDQRKELQSTADQWNKFYDAVRPDTPRLKVDVQVPIPVDPRQTREAMQLELQRIQLLGDMATAQDKARQKELEIGLARLDSAGKLKLSNDEAQRLINIAKMEEESRRVQIRATLDLTTATDALAEARRRLDILVAQGKITPDEAASRLLQTQIKTLKEMVPAFKAAADAGEQFTNSLVQGLLQGQNVLQAMENAAKNLASTFANRAITSLFAGDITGAAINTAIAGASFIFSRILGRDREEREREARRQEAALRNISLHQTLTGNAPGSIMGQIQSVQQQGIDALRTAWENRDAAEANRILAEFTQFVARVTQEFRDGFEGMLAGLKATGSIQGPFSQANQQVRDLGRTLRGFIQDVNVAGLGNRMDEAWTAVVGAIRATVAGTPALSDLQTELQRIQGAAAGAQEVLQQLGVSADEAATIINEDLTTAINQLREKAVNDLQRKINDLLQRGYINDFLDLFDQVKQMAADFAALNLDPAQITQFFGLAAQDIVNRAGLTGQALQDLITQFPQLAGVVHDATNTIVRSARDIADARASLEERLMAATTDTSTLSGALAMFEFQAQRERAAEAAAGGENMVLLERVLSAERLQIINRFAQQAIEEEQRAAEERQRALEEAQNALDAFSRKIKEFVTGLKTGTESPLAPGARVQAAQAAFDQQMQIILSGTAEERRAAMDSITTYAQNLLSAQQAFSPATFPATFQTIVSQLESLPEQINVQELILQAVKDNTTQTVNATSLLQQELVTAFGSALASGNLDTIANVLSTFLPIIDTNTDNMIDFPEMVNALGSYFPSGTLADIFRQLDINGDGFLSSNELNRQQLVNLNYESDYQTQLLASQQALLSSINNLNAVMSSQIVFQTDQNGYLMSLSNTSVQQLGAIQNLGYEQAAWLNKVNANLVSQNLGWSLSGRANLPAYYELGGVIPPGSLGYVGEHGPNPRLIQAGSRPIVVTPDVGANDNNALLTEIRELRREVEMLRRVTSSGHAMVREGVDQLVYTSAETAANEKLKTAAAR